MSDLSTGDVLAAYRLGVVLGEAIHALSKDGILYEESNAISRLTMEFLRYPSPINMERVNTLLTCVVNESENIRYFKKLWFDNPKFYNHPEFSTALVQGLSAANAN